MAVIIIAAALLAAVDQFSKYLAVSRLKPVGSVTVIDGFFDLTFVENRGAAFGILNGQRWFFIIITIAVTAGVLIYLWKANQSGKTPGFLRPAFVLILAGAWGNALDRLFRGYVVDYFEFTFINYPVFNVADIDVVAGTIAMAVILIFFVKDEDADGEG